MTTTNTPDTSTTEISTEADSSSESIDDIATAFADVFSDGTTAEAEQEATPVSTAPAEPEQAATEAEVTPALLSPLLAAASARDKEARASAESTATKHTEELSGVRAAMLRELMDNPKQFIKDHPELKEVAGDLALHMYNLDLGDEAPPELQAELGVTELERFKSQHERDIAELRTEANNRVIQARNSAVMDQYVGLVDEIPTTLPYLAAEALADSDDVLRTMAAIGDHEFERTGKYPSATEVATQIERQLSITAERLSLVKPPTVNTPQTVPVAKETNTTETLSAANQGSSGRKTPVGEDELFADALEQFKGMFPAG